MPSKPVTKTVLPNFRKGGGDIAGEEKIARLTTEWAENTPQLKNDSAAGF